MHLLVTRPQNDSAELIKQLKGHGHNVIHDPLLRIVFAEDAVIETENLQAVLITSANGARALQNHSAMTKVKSLTAFTVGPASAKAAKQAGFDDIEQVVPGDVNGLVDYVKLHLGPSDGKVLYASGTKTTGDLVNRLAKSGFKVARSVLYEAIPAKKLNEKTKISIQNGNLDGVLLYSPRTAKIWITITKGCFSPTMLTSLRYYCLSDNVANAIRRGLGEDCKITICNIAQSDAMVAAINAE